MWLRARQKKNHTVVRKRNSFDVHAVKWLQLAREQLLGIRKELQSMFLISNLYLFISALYIYHVIPFHSSIPSHLSAVRFVTCYKINSVRTNDCSDVIWSLWAMWEKSVIAIDTYAQIEGDYGVGGWCAGPCTNETARGINKISSETDKNVWQATTVPHWQFHPCCGTLCYHVWSIMCVLVWFWQFHKAYEMNKPKHTSSSN